MAEGLVINLSHARDAAQKATIAFVTANAAISSGRKATVFLSLEGVRFSEVGYAEGIHSEGFAPLNDLIASFAEAGGEILVCLPCFNKYGLDRRRLVPGAIIATDAKLVEFAGAGDCYCWVDPFKKNDATLPFEIKISDPSIEQETLITPILYEARKSNQTETARRLWLAELDHRVNNILASIQSIALLTLKTADSAAFVETFNGRLQALALTHSLLNHSGGKGANFAVLLQGQLTSVCDDVASRISIWGPRVQIGPEAAIDLAIALHELATNSRKYGSLSKPKGRISVRWFLADANQGQAELHLKWVESDGPAVTPPARRGFGTAFIENRLGEALGGEARVTFEPFGVVCEIRLPLRVQAPGPECDEWSSNTSLPAPRHHCGPEGVTI